MKDTRVRESVAAGRHVDTMSTYAIVALFVGMLALGAVATIHALFGILTDALTGVI